METRNVLLLILLINCRVFETKHSRLLNVTEKCTKYHKLVKDGSIMHMVYLPMFWSSKQLSMTNLMIIEAVEYATEIQNAKIKSLQQKSNLNITFGYIIYDTCDDKDVLTNQILETIIKTIKNTRLSGIDNLYSCSCHTDMQQPSILGYMGVFSEILSLQAATMLLPDNYPTFSLDENTANLNSRVYKRYFQMSAVNEAQANLITRLVKYYRWKYVGIVSSSNTYGFIGKDLVTRQLEQDGVCIGLNEYFPSEQRQQQIDALMNSIQSNKRMRVIILWLTKEDGKIFFKNAAKFEIYNRTWITSFEMRRIKLSFLHKLNPQLIHGMLLTRIHKSSYIPTQYRGFIKYFSLLTCANVTKTWLQKFCYERNGFGKSIRLLTKSNENRLDVMVVKLLSALDWFSSLVEDVIQSHENISYQQFHENIKFKAKNLSWEPKMFSRQTVSILQVDKYNISLVRVAFYDTRLVNKLQLYNNHSKNNWAGRSILPPISACSNVCGPGMYSLTEGTSCCWSCIPCAKGFFKNMTSNSICTKCPIKTDVNNNRTACLEYRTVIIGYFSTEGYVLYGFVLFGLILTTSVIVLFAKNKNTPIVRSSNIPLTFIQLSAQSILFASLVTMLDVDIVKCTLNPIIHGFLYTLIHAILYAKAQYLLIIFQTQRRMTEKRLAKIRKIQSVRITVPLILQLTLSAVQWYMSPLTIYAQQNKQTLTSEVYCGNFYYYVAQMLYVILLTIVCMIQAFRVRKLPSNYNEGRNIMVSAFLTLLYISVSGVVNFNQTTASEVFYTNCLLLYINNITILVIMFSQKAYVIIFQPYKNNRRSFQSECYLTVRESKKNVNIKFNYNQ